MRLIFFDSVGILILRCGFMSEKILSDEILKYIGDYYECRNSCEDLPQLMGRLALSYTKKAVPKEDIMNFLKQLARKIIVINCYWAERISNFMEIVMVHRMELMQEYVELVEDFKERADFDSMSILYRAVVIPCFRNRLDVNKVVRKFRYPWRSYELMACYNSYYNRNIQAIHCICKAVKTCPRELKEEYLEKKAHLLGSVLH